ncbi:MAG: type II/IV secretion system protein [Kiritimatiellae bacterium]|jgi:type IV pilus assembly protein PilB|nr:type II/IV secretion system protein [Kiritimatiellia bacterium]
MLDPILQILVNNGYIDEDGAADLQDLAKTEAKSVRQLVIDQEIITEDDLLACMAANEDTEAIDLGAMTIETEVTEAIPASTARMYNVFPVAADDMSVTLATFDLVDPRISDEMLFTLSKEVRFVFAREKDVMDRIAQYYGDSNDSVADMIKSLGEGMSDEDAMGANSDDIASIESAANSSAIIRFVNLVLYQGVVDRASDIHIEPFENDFKIRYRVDGALYEMKAPDVKMAPAIISRIKILSNLNISERRIPQDGRIALTVAGKPVDLRVSCLPTAHGESVVMRILDQSATSLDLENVGLPEDVYEQITMDVEKPNGIFIVTGPTGSGKTTTLYSILRRINQIDTKLLTAEEPVEYNVDGIVQVPIDPKVGNTFAKVLRAFLRQDPDVMMIGEIRDLETAEIAIQAALTGHFVFSTLHTNDAAGAVTRFVDMNVAPYLLSSTLEGVLGQRLVRTCCRECRQAYEPDDETLERIEMTRDQIGGRPFYYGAGCKVCNGTGYKGRKAVVEYLRISNPLRELINTRAPTLILREKARELGMRTMREHGIQSILDGYTTVDEVLRYT